MNELYQVYNKDCRSMSELEDNSAQCVVASPPYWGLRKYAGEQELIWGDNQCRHEWLDEIVRRDRGKAVNFEVVGQPREKIGTTTPQGSFCSICGAWKGAYGLEPTPEMYIEHTIEILREIRRVLRKDGVVFWNIGDAYFGGGFGTSPGGTQDFATRYPKQASNLGTAEHEDRKLLGGLKKKHPILKPKDLCLIPFRLAIAAQEDGWWVRSVIIWSKPNPMPESVKDRPTESHEYILMLTKSAKYYWDQEAVREKYSETVRWGGDKYKGAVKKGTHGEDAGLDRERSVYPSVGRNLRTVWEFPTQPYPEAHFAIFPEKLPEICIKAASKPDDLILDPFAGAGTTLKVAIRLRRKAVGYEISQEYCRMIDGRLSAVNMELFQYESKATKRHVDKADKGVRGRHHQEHHLCGPTGAG